MRVTTEDFNEYFTLQGRRYVSDGRLFLNASGGSLQGTVQGTILSFAVSSDHSEKGRNAYVSVIVDGRRKKRVRLPKGEKLISLCLTAGAHEFEIVKLTESANNSFGVAYVETDGEFLPMEKKRRLKIEFIGDSITTGFGVLCRETYGEYKTKEQDFTKAFPYLVSKSLDADYNVVAAGGWPIYKSKYAPFAIPDYYGKVDLIRNQAPFDCSSFDPDIVVVTLGTNDFSYLADLSVEQAALEREEVLRKYIDFLRRILSLYPRAEVVLFYGFFEYSGLGVLTKEVAAILASPRVHTLETASAASLNDVRAGHPGKKTHKRAAKNLLRILKKLI